MFALVIKAVRVGLVALLFSILYSVFNLWFYGLFNVNIILIGIHIMTLISIIPYAVVNVIYNVKYRHDGRWIIYVALSFSLLFTVSVAFAKLMELDKYIAPINVPQLRYDGTLALSMVLLGLATLLYLSSVIPDVEKIAGRIALALRESKEEEAYEVEVV